MKRNKVILITGTSGKLGSYLVKFFLKKNFFVIGCSRTHPKITNKKYMHISLDLSDEYSIEKKLNVLKEKKIKIDVLINNAAVSSLNHFTLMPVTNFSRTIKINLISHFLITQLISRNMIKNKIKGRIINISSILVKQNMPGHLAYTISKAGIESMTKTLAHELSQFNITINAVSPNTLEEGLSKNLSITQINNSLGRQAIKRKGRQEDISNAISFLISPQSDFITGHVLYLGGP